MSEPNESHNSHKQCVNPEPCWLGECFGCQVEAPDPEYLCAGTVLMQGC